MLITKLSRIRLPNNQLYILIILTCTNTIQYLQLPKWVLTLVVISGTKTTFFDSDPTYIELANKIGARVFSILTNIAKGYSFILSNNVYNAKEGTGNIFLQRNLLPIKGYNQ